MADEQPSAQGNGSAEMNGGEAQVSVIAQYVKDLSVESPSSPQVFQWQVQPQVDVQFNISVAQAADEVHEVTLKIEVSGRSDNGVHFVVDLAYAGLYMLRGIPNEAMQPFLLIEAPRLLFPFARQIVAEAISNTGFAPLLLDPIDFGSAYLQQLEAQGGGEGGSAGETPGEPSGEA